MERTLEVACEGTASSFAIRKLSRATLYGTRRRVPVDAEGRECRAAALTRDGRFLLPPGTTATLCLDDHGDAVERGELRAARTGQDVASAPEPQSAEAANLLDCVVRQVYALAPVAVSAQLDRLLAGTDHERMIVRVVPLAAAGPVARVAEDDGHCVVGLEGVPVVLRLNQAARGNRALEHGGGPVPADGGDARGVVPPLLVQQEP